MSPWLRKEVLVLRREGKKLKENAEIINLHPVTVGKVCREHNSAVIRDFEASRLDAWPVQPRSMAFVMAAKELALVLAFTDQEKQVAVGLYIQGDHA